MNNTIIDTPSYKPESFNKSELSISLQAKEGFPLENPGKTEELPTENSKKENPLLILMH